MTTFTHIALVAIGSACGGLLRWAVGLMAGRWLGAAFPWGTLAINVSGCLFLGWFSTLLIERLPLTTLGWLRSDDLRLFVAIGFTGSYTTFSTYEWESHSLLRDGQTVFGFAYLVGSVVLGLVAVRLGVMLARI